VTRDEAQRECERLRREHPERASGTWLVQEETSDEWVVVRVDAPGLKVADDRFTAEQAAPPSRPDPGQDRSEPQWLRWGFPH